MRRLMKWTARRSGPMMTIEGTDAATDADVKITGVKEIAVGQSGRIFAVTESEDILLLSGVDPVAHAA